jgi:hypothetical protein
MSDTTEMFEGVRRLLLTRFEKRAKSSEHSPLHAGVGVDA